MQTNKRRLERLETNGKTAGAGQTGEDLRTGIQEKLSRLAHGLPFVGPVGSRSAAGEDVRRAIFDRLMKIREVTNEGK